MKKQGTPYFIYDSKTGEVIGKGYDPYSAAVQCVIGDYKHRDVVVRQGSNLIFVCTQGKLEASTLSGREMSEAMQTALFYIKNMDENTKKLEAVIDKNLPLIHCVAYDKYCNDYPEMDVSFKYYLIKKGVKIYE